ncbi:MAG: fimbrial biogenesis outer membrane usher protein [Croceibacterium sp.]
MTRAPKITLLLSAGVASLVTSGAAHAGVDSVELAVADQAEQPVAAPSRATRLNPTGRNIVLTVPAKDGATFLGDMPVTIGADQSVTFPLDRALQLLGEVLAPDVLQSLRSNLRGPQVTSADFAPTGITVRYDPQRLELVFTIPVERRASRSVAVSAMDRERIGTVLRAEDTSFYLNMRSSIDLVEEGFDQGFENPTFLLDAAARFGNVVAESDAIYSPGSFGNDFQRLGTRLVYDRMDQLTRFTVGDLETTGRGFQSVPDIAGVSAARVYSVLNPQQVIRPRGDRSFTLDRQSTVEVLVNGQQVRRLQLAPGNYDLRDFPFAQGGNDIRLNVLDDTGRTEILRFNIFLDQTQLAPGLSEFGFYLGVKSPLGQSGPDYSNDPIFSGFYRRGITDFLTLGANFQGDGHSAMGGAEAVFASAIGTFGVQAAGSTQEYGGQGYAVQATFQHMIQTGNGKSDTLNLFAERRSKDFGPVSFFLSENPFEYEVGGGYSHAFNERVYAGVDARYGKGRANRLDVTSLRLTSGWRISDSATLGVEARYVADTLGKEVSAFASLTVRLGRSSTIRGEYDSRDNRARTSFQTLHGSGVGSYNVSADIERSDFGSGMNVNANYYTNRAELGFSHYGVFNGDFGRSISQRSTFRAASSIAFAGGEMSIGRPIYDSFAIVKPHKGLGKASIVVDPSPYGSVASTGAFGTATAPSLSSYAERTLTVDVENAAPGVDVGTGAYRLFPAYRSGYLLEVGSDYNVTAMGTMLDIDGQPLALVSGTAVEVDKPGNEPVVLFTNRQGRFGATGLAPGRWRIEMNDAAKSVYEIEIPAGATGIARIGEIKPKGK